MRIKHAVLFLARIWGRTVASRHTLGPIFRRKQEQGHDAIVHIRVIKVRCAYYYWLHATPQGEGSPNSKSDASIIEQEIANGSNGVMPILQRDGSGQGRTPKDGPALPCVSQCLHCTRQKRG
eukprot:SAG11_NODE_1440_length_4905_cov_6.216188_2_plen_122_part_00